MESDLTSVLFVVQMSTLVCVGIEDVFHEGVGCDFFGGCGGGVDVEGRREVVFRDPSVVLVFEVIEVECPAVCEGSVVYECSCSLVWGSVCLKRV